MLSRATSPTMRDIPMLRFIVRPVGASMFEVYDRQFSRVVAIPYHPRRTRQRVRSEAQAAEYATRLNVGGWS